MISKWATKRPLYWVNLKQLQFAFISEIKSHICINILLFRQSSNLSQNKHVYKSFFLHSVAPVAKLYTSLIWNVKVACKALWLYPWKPVFKWKHWGHQPVVVIWLQSGVSGRGQISLWEMQGVSRSYAVSLTHTHHPGAAWHAKANLALAGFTGTVWSIVLLFDLLADCKM